MQKPSKSLSVAAWSLATVATAIPYPGVLLYAWCFPLGVFRIIFPPGHGENVGREVGLIFFVGIWILYLFLTIFGIGQGRRAGYFFTYAIFMCAVSSERCRLPYDEHDSWKT